MREPFQTRVRVRGYEVDMRGHLNNAVYHQYAEHTRWECLRAAGLTQEKMTAAGLGPVQLEATIRFRSELVDGDEVDVSCVFVWGEGKTFRLDQDFRRPDGTLAAELTTTGGLLDLTTRRLVADPAGHWRGLVGVPELLGL
ncbi:acyl-CoA thioester hydrolase [Murinocardiopsis flavida]|uniref:Acyl-CoA thioester hydrolase n=1 Tax=Murinocardiopsis flavida TaxID=645275 RepID=A0A2P8DK97_9ACTN|nr:acyl-CoA thioesterase [Murinocardiopsis flavida]PSK97650.1 acyl-CoA thioester hydrolase [Murinocardiopsis flavida]